MTIDLDKWAAVLTEFTPGMYRRMLGRELLNMDREPFASLKQTYSEFIAARPTDAPALIDPARLRELEADAARFRWLCSLQSGRPESQIALATVILAMRKNPEAVRTFIDEQIAKQEQPR